MSPLQAVLGTFKFPPYIESFHPLQADAVDGLAPLNNSGLWLDMGTGKTLVSTACSLFLRITYGLKTIVIVPAILVAQWGRWLRSITPALKVLEFRGDPKKRKAMSLDVDFVIVSIQIFKREITRFREFFSTRPYNIIVDEATMLANIGSQNHEMVYGFAVGIPIQLLSGTPTDQVMDAYGLLKFTAPGVYRNFKHFENMHVEERDFFDKPVKFQNLDLLATNLAKNSKRVLFKDMYPHSEDPLYIPVHYDLSPEHYKLYRKLANEQLLKLPDGGKIDATTAGKLLHALGQIVVNQAHFSGAPADASAGVEMIEQRLSELGSGKLVIFANYRLTIAQLVERLKPYGAVAINSEVSEKMKEYNLQRFCSDEDTRVIIIQFVSGGKGLDGMQHVCHDCLFIEPCTSPRDFHQCVARLNRMGQKNRVRVTLAIANGTNQVRQFKNLLIKDGLVNEVIRNAVDLKNAIFGE